MADKDHLAILKKGVKAWNEWRRKNHGIHPDLSGANLFEANLGRVNLGRVDLGRADLGEANLIEANLGRANLSEANLIEANLSVANLSLANLSLANLSLANLSGANLFEVNLGRANLSLANLSGVKLYETVFANVDLTEAKGLNSCKHIGSSTVDHRTIQRSGKLPRKFLLGCGVPLELYDAIVRMKSKVMYYTCFVAYGEPERKFAEKLTKSLKAKGISCWLYAMDATAGKKTWKEISEKRRGADRVIVLCSGKALVRSGLLKEIEDQINEDPDKLMPISLDNFWKERGFKVMTETKDLKPFLKELNYADFANQSYKKALAKLLEGLKRTKKSR